MRMLWSLALTTLVAAPAMASSYVIDPIASLPYVVQQISATTPNPQFVQLSTFAAPTADASCATLGWTFNYFAPPAPVPPAPGPVTPVPPAPHGARDTQALTSFNLWMQNVNGACTWTSTSQAANASADSSAVINDFLFNRRIITVDSAVNVSFSTVGQQMQVASISLALDATAGVPFYTIASDLCAAASAFRVSAEDGSIAAAAPIDACAYKANLLMGIDSTATAAGTRESLRVYRDGQVLSFNDTAVVAVAALSQDRLTAAQTAIDALTPGTLTDVTTTPPAPCPVNSADHIYEVRRTDGMAFNIAEARADCHALLLQQDGAAQLRQTLDDLSGLAPQVATSH